MAAAKNTPSKNDVPEYPNDPAPTEVSPTAAAPKPSPKKVNPKKPAGPGLIPVSERPEYADLATRKEDDDPESHVGDEA